jgi:acetyl esterase
MTVPESRLAGLAYIDLQVDPEEVARVEHRFIPGPTADLPVRIYYPTGAGPTPAYVLYHGSGWVIANLDVADRPARALANRAGCAVVAVNYQKAPEHKFPVPLDDCYAALCWTAENAADHSFDTPSYQENAEGYLLQRESMRWFWNHYLRDSADGKNPYASPLQADDLSGLPPAFVVTAEFDPLRDEGEAYAQRLREAGVPVRLTRYDGMIHGFDWMSGVLDQARRLDEEVGAQARAALGG